MRLSRIAQLLPVNSCPFAMWTSLSSSSLTPRCSTGSEVVDVTVHESKNTVTLHAYQLEVTEATFTTAAGSDPVKASSITLDEKGQTVTLGFGESALPAGTGKLRITFKGTLNDELAGLYRYKYKSQDGKERNGACTQFEASE